jgi:hypothetical protein
MAPDSGNNLVQPNVATGFKGGIVRNSYYQPESKRLGKVGSKPTGFTIHLRGVGYGYTLPHVGILIPHTTRK